MPVAFLSLEPGGGFVPVATTPFVLGSDPGADLIEGRAEVRPRHALLRYVKGEPVLTAGDDCRVTVNAEETPLMSLRDGDEVRLEPAGGRWVFRNRLEGTFRPDGASLTEAWMGCPAFAEEEHGPERFGEGLGVAGRDPARCRLVADPGGEGDLVVKRLGRLRNPAEGDAWLRVLMAVGGAPHPALPVLVDGGLARAEGGARRWMAVRWIEGVTAAAKIDAGGVDVVDMLRVLRPLADALAHLHRRGVVHRDVSPGNVILRPTGDAVLIDLGQAVPADGGATLSRGVVGTPGYVAPEEVVEGAGAVSPAVDAYGLAAVGYALLTGRPPAEGEDLLERLAGAARPPPRLRDLGVDLPAALEWALLEALSLDPTARPSAATLLGTLRFAEARLGLAGEAS